jgi:hypothetical protein
MDDLLKILRVRVLELPDIARALPIVQCTMKVIIWPASAMSRKLCTAQVASF